ncbi:MAG TPA: chorismate-binding protein [Chryseosolibacter sp.]|nr:chorismate-binding protein [Chryseosolibacter sp.]
MTTVSAVSHSKYSERELLAFLLSHAEFNENPVAVWRLPGNDTTNVIIADNYEELKGDDLIEDRPTGFLFAPFDKSKPRLFLRANQFFSFRDGDLVSDPAPFEERSQQWLREQLQGEIHIPRYTPRKIKRATVKDLTKDAFLQLVDAGLREIDAGRFRKIVPSRTRTITLPDEFEVVQAFQKLCIAHPQALISFVSIPGVGTWLGATPELLVCVRDKKIFKTVALAGTLPHHAGTDIRSVAWTQKEIEEQALVERYVISCFKKIRLREYDEQGPRTVIAGNLMHLKSEFTVDIQATNFPQIGSVMLELLHPTSAVCGMPLEPSLAFLKDHEPHDRGFYSGYLGPVNVHNNIELFVNIRCMQLAGNEAILYAGAGITIDSVPDKEWAETEMKLNTLLNVIL